VAAGFVDTEFGKAIPAAALASMGISFLVRSRTNIYRQKWFLEW
jgi:hypothetical protein